MDASERGTYVGSGEGHCSSLGVRREGESVEGGEQFGGTGGEQGGGKTKARGQLHPSRILSPSCEGVLTRRVCLGWVEGESVEKWDVVGGQEKRVQVWAILWVCLMTRSLRTRPPNWQLAAWPDIVVLLHDGAATRIC